MPKKTIEDMKRQIYLESIRLDLHAVDAALARAVRAAEEIHGHDGQGGFLDLLLLVKLRLELIQITMPRDVAAVTIGEVPPMDADDKQRIRELVPNLKIVTFADAAKQQEDHHEQDDKRPDDA